MLTTKGKILLALGGFVFICAANNDKSPATAHAPRGPGVVDTRNFPAPSPYNIFTDSNGMIRSLDIAYREVAHEATRFGFCERTMNAHYEGKGVVAVSCEGGRRFRKWY